MIYFWNPQSGTGALDVTSADVIADGAVVVGDGGSRGIKGSLVAVDGSGNLSTPGDITTTGSLFTGENGGSNGAVQFNDANSLFSVSVVPTTLTANRAAVLPDLDGAVAIQANAATFTNLTLTGAYIGSTQPLSGAGAANVTTETTKITSTGLLDAITLADGVDGQVKRIVHDVDGGSFVLTPATATGWTTFTSTVVGETITLLFVTTRGWMVVGNFGGVIA